MKRAICVVLVFFVLAILGHNISWAQCDYSGGSSADSSDLEEGRGEMNQMDSSMSAQPGDSLDSLEEKGMDVQSGDAIDSEGTGAH
jgi:hypothetical protein